MKIDFEGRVRTLDLEHVKLKHIIAIQDYTGLAVFAWQERLSGLGDLKEADVTGLETADGGIDLAQALKAMRKTSMYIDRAWIVSVAAAHWLMLAQSGEDVPALDDDYECDALAFAGAYMTALGEEVKAKAVQDKPGPTASRARRAPSSKRTASPETTRPADPSPPSLTGS